MQDTTELPDYDAQRGVYLEFVDFEQLVNTLNPPPIFVNDLDTSTKENREILSTVIRTNYDGDELSIIPSCECGELTKEHNSGLRCSNCGTIVTSVTQRPIQSDIWIRNPAGIHTLMAPNFWYILKSKFTVVGFSIIEWLCSTNYKPTPKSQGIVDRLTALGIQRGYNLFCKHFDTVIPMVLAEVKEIGTRAKRAEIQDWIDEVKGTVFTKYLPIPNKLAFITEKTVVGTYADTKMTSAMDAVLTICNIDESQHGTSQTVKENRVVKVLNQLSTYYMSQFSTALGKKEGWFRKHIFGTRIAYGGRAVITSLSENHDYDEIHVPWGFAIGLFRLHITNKLLLRGMSPSAITRFLISHTRVYNEMLDGIFKELIREGIRPDLGLNLSKGEGWVQQPDARLSTKGIPCQIQRNPSLARGSSQHVYITKVKADPNINSISFGVNVLSAPNAD